MSDAITQEILERVLRVESRLVRLADGLKIDVRSKSKLRVVQYEGDDPLIETTGTDITLSQMISTCKEKGISGILVDVYLNTKFIGSVQT